MYKKTIIISLILFILSTGIQLVYAQRVIDPSLKPGNVPEMPKTGLSRDECLKKYKDAGFASKFDPDKDDFVYIGDEELAKIVWDEDSDTCKGEGVAEPIIAFLQIIGGALLMLSGGIAVIVIALGGVMYIIGRGNAEKTEKAKKVLIYGIIGMLVVIFSYYIIGYILRLVIG